MAALKRLATLCLACLLPATASGFCFEEAGNEYGVSRCSLTTSVFVTLPPITIFLVS